MSNPQVEHSPSGIWFTGAAPASPDRSSGALSVLVLLGTEHERRRVTLKATFILIGPALVIVLAVCRRIGSHFECGHHLSLFSFLASDTLLFCRNPPSFTAWYMGGKTVSPQPGCNLLWLVQNSRLSFLFFSFSVCVRVYFSFSRAQLGLLLFFSLILLLAAGCFLFWIILW